MPTLRPNGGTTYCTIEVGKFSNTYDGNIATGACFRKDQTCLSEWYWDTPVKVTKFSIYSLYYYPDSRINAIWGRVNGSWVLVWGWGEWKPARDTWASKNISCDNCTGIRISQTHHPQPSRPCITEVRVDYEAIPEGEATIVSITKPPNFTPGVQFDIRPKMRNDGGEDIFFVRLTDRDTGATLKLTTRSTTLLPGGTWTSPMYITLDQTTDFYGRIQFGHLENGTRVVDDTEDFTIPVKVEPECTPDGRRETIENCWDGSIKRERVCEYGKWRYYDYTCPEEKECTIEGEEEIVEYCPDGYSTKRKKVCENGKWVYYDVECAECTEGEEEVVEWCPDGYTVKRKKICRNGEWVTEDYECAACYPEGFEEILEYCEYSYDVKRKRVCEDGKWKYYDYTCPACYEGESEVIEYCPDGSTVKREKVCINGKWVEKTYTCPGERGRIIEMMRAFLDRFLG